MHLMVEEVGEEHPSTIITTTASLLDPSPPEMSHALTAFIAPESSFLSRHSPVEVDEIFSDPDKTPGH